MNEEVLTYLQGNSTGATRDMIARCFYEVAQGDPESGPVAFAVLLDACAREFARTPRDLVSATAEFKKVLADARDFEQRILERVDRSNASVIAAFKDETARTTLALQVAVLDAKATVIRAEQIQSGMKPVIATTRDLGKDLIGLKIDLERFDTSVQRVATIGVGIEATHVATSDLVRTLTTEIRANWTTLGFGFGMALEYGVIESPFPNSISFVFFAMGVGLIHQHFRRDWRFPRTLIAKIVPPRKTKPPV
jgi:hypothetical protein